MKKLLICMVVATALCLCACSKKEEETVQIANPWVEYSSLQEAIKASGIEISVPTSNIKLIQVMNNEIIEVDYNDETSIRKGSVEDISGDYNTYIEVSNSTIGDYSVTLSGNDSKIYLATWTYGNYNYSISCEGLSVEDISNLIAQVK